MKDYLKEIQNDSLVYDAEYLFSECKRRYLKAASFVGYFNDDVKDLDESNKYYAGELKTILIVLYNRYHRDHCDDQIDLFEPYEEMVKRRWYSFIFKIRTALVENDTFCKCCLRLGGYLKNHRIESAFSTAIHIIEDIDLRWYLSDEPKRMDENEYV